MAASLCPAGWLSLLRRGDRAATAALLLTGWLARGPDPASRALFFAPITELGPPLTGIDAAHEGQADH